MSRPGKAPKKQRGTTWLGGSELPPAGGGDRGDRGRISGLYPEQLGLDMIIL